MTIKEYALRFLRVLFQVFVVFPYSAFTTPRLAALPSIEERMKGRRSDDGDDDGRGGAGWEVSDKVLRMCTSSESVSGLMAEDETLSPGEAWKALYSGDGKRFRVEPAAGTATDHEQLQALSGLDRVAACGKWGPTRPCDLFLEMYRDALRCVDEDPETALVSPSLMGTCGVVPLTIISVIPDIARHMSNLIVRAEKEVIIATNYWSNGEAAQFLAEGIRELSRRAGARGGGARVVVKVIYDRGSVKQLVEPHYLAAEREWTAAAVGLPARADVPHVDLQVMNYHHPMLGTFHSKFVIVDRRIAAVQSNNIQDNDNLEMMVHVEGPVVDALYDMALLSWHRKLEPPLPSRTTPAAGGGGVGSFGTSHAGIFGPGGTIRGHDAVIDPGKITFTQAFGRAADDAPAPAPESIAGGSDAPAKGPTTTWGATHPVDDGSQSATATTSNGASPAPAQEAHGQDRKTDSYLHEGDQALPQAQIQHPSSATSPLSEHTVRDPHYDADIAAEVARVQTAVSPRPGESRMRAVTRLLNHTTNAGFAGAPAPECAPRDEMTPYVPHPVHDPVPIALVNRPPHGPPTHSSVATPQNEAWLSAFRNARRNVFIQSPTLNAEPLVPAIVGACERGVDVYCYICLGYNDAGELLPMQGGHNELVAHQLHTSLSPEARARLHYFWYVAKDQTAPLPQVAKRRSCHIKLLIADERVAIVGSGNQDTQSWFQSQEVNLMLDSPALCRAWIDALRRNQNTHLYGAVGREDGVWRDAEGREAEGAMGVDPGRFSWARGLIGAVKRVQGKGGFG